MYELSLQQRIRSSPAGFAHVASKNRWKAYPHLSIENRLAQEIAAGTIKRAADFQPPQHGKSLLGTGYHMAWRLCNFPDDRLGILSYANNYAERWGGVVRSLVTEMGQQYFDLAIDRSSEAKAFWKLAKFEGYLASVGIEGSLTGTPLDGLRMDDLVKGPKEAQSPTYRRTAYEMYQTVATTRLSKNAWQWMTFTRWHQDDPAGRILGRARETGEPWLVIELPAIAEEDEDGEYIIRNSIGYDMKNPAVARIVKGWHRKAGEALCPALHPLSQLEQQRDSMSAYFWAAMYQQRPRPLSGGIFRQQNFRYWHMSEDGLFANVVDEVVNKDGSEQVRQYPMSSLAKFATVDLAISTKTSADFTVVSIWGYTPARDLLLLDRVRMRLEGPDQVPLIESLYRKWKPRTIKVESVAYQLSLVQTLWRKNLPVVACYVDKDKTSRALDSAGFIEAHKVFWPRDVSWLDEWETEFLDFPNSDFDDQVDTFSLATKEEGEEDDATLVSW